MLRADLMGSLVMAGRVKRYHTWPTITQQTVADHTWGVMRVYVGIFGPPETDVWVRILFHDVAELHTGDLPWPIKKNNPDLRDELVRIEDEALRHLGIKPPPITDSEETYIKISDLIEMYQFAQMELWLGNQLALVVAEDMINEARKIADKAGCLGIVDDYLTRRPHG